MQLFERAEIEAAVGIDADALAVVEDGFRALARGEVEMPPVLSLHVPEHNGEVDVKTAYVRGFERFAIKVSPGFFDNPKLGLPSLNGLMLLFSARTGVLEAILLDEGYLTAVRTAIAGAIAAKHLSNDSARTVAILGAGEQAFLQATALRLVRPVESVRIWGRDPHKAAALAERLGSVYENAAPCEDIGSALSGADIVVTTTPSTHALVMAEMLEPGMHVTAMGSDQAGKQEIAYEALLRADTVVVDRRSQSETLGELQHRGERPLPRDLRELGSVIESGRRVRFSDTAITVCDLTGTGVQDTAIASHAFETLGGADGLLS